MSHLRLTYKTRILLLLSALLIGLVFIAAQILVERNHALAMVRVEEERQYMDRLHRPVVTTFQIDRAEWDGVSLRIWGYLDKRECQLNPPDNPYEAVRYYIEKDGWKLDPVADYDFGESAERYSSRGRPAGATAVDGWRITPGGQYDETAVIVGEAAHNCGFYQGQPVNPKRPFARFRISDVLGAATDATAIESREPPD